MNLNYIAEPQVLLDAAFSRGKKSAMQRPRQKTVFYTVKGNEITKIDVSAEYLVNALDGAIKSFPNIEQMPPFYKDLLECIIDADEARKNMSRISSAVELIKKLRRESLVRLKELKFTSGYRETITKISKAYFGRVSSSINQLKAPIKAYNETAKMLKEMPKIDVKEDHYFLAGFPNVGKSTLLTKITTSKPEIASYPFTTKGLNVGVFEKKYMPIKVIDMPGLLDRELHKRNNIELKAITALQHLKGTILFVVDPLDELEKQHNLLDELRKLFTGKEFIIVINKSDIASPEQIARAKEGFQGFVTVVEGKGLSTLKEELLK